MATAQSSSDSEEDGEDADDDPRLFIRLTPQLIFTQRNLNSTLLQCIVNAKQAQNTIFLHVSG